MMLKSRGLNAIDPGVILKKKEKISMNKGPIDKCQKFRGQIENSHFSQENDAVLNRCSSPSSSPRKKPIQQEKTSPNQSWVTSPARSTNCPISLAPTMHLQGSLPTVL